MLGRAAIRFSTAVDRPVTRYALAGLCVAAAALARMGIAALTHAPPAFPTFFVGLLIAAVVGGAGPGLAAVGLSGVVVWRMWLVENGAPPAAAQLVQMATFLVCGGLIVLIIEALRLAVRRGLAAEERFRRAQEASLDAFVILEPIQAEGEVIDFRWTYANPAAEALRPSGLSSLIGRRVREAFPDDTGVQMSARLARLLDDGGPDEIDVLRVIDGREHWIRSSGVRLGSGVAVTFRDVTQEKRATEALRTSEEQFRSVADAAPVLIWISDPEGSAVWFNSAWLRFRGRTPAQEVAQGWLEGVHPDDRDPSLTVVTAAIRARLPFQVSYRLRRADGAWRWIDSAGAPRHDAYGGYQGYVGSGVDMTESVEARRDLEARVAERTEALEASLAERAKAEAALAQAQRLETVGRLTGGVAHDFNNLLTVIIGGLDMILRHPEDPARVARLAEAALAAGQRGERLTRQLLAFSRNQELKPETADVPALIAQIEPLLRRAVGEAITLTLRADQTTGASQVDPAQFEAALLNLVVNAVDATPAGGEITIDTRAVTLKAGEIGDAAAGDYARVTVSDTGQGMAREVLERVFDPFFTTKEVGKGTGLGLAQVYGFVRQCGGAVTVDSVEGEGTAVALYLPAAPVGSPVRGPGEAAVSGLFQAPAVGPAIGARVLLVEDDEAVRAMTEGLLVDFGCDLTTAQDGHTALALFEAGGQFDLLISDIVMPGGLTGVDLAKAVSPDRPDMAVLLTTGYAGDRIAGAAADLPWPVLRKPFRVEQLAEAVTRALAGRAGTPVEG